MDKKRSETQEMDSKIIITFPHNVALVGKQFVGLNNSSSATFKVFSGEVRFEANDIENDCLTFNLTLANASDIALDIFYSFHQNEEDLSNLVSVGLLQLNRTAQFKVRTDSSSSNTFMTFFHTFQFTQISNSTLTNDIKLSLRDDQICDCKLYGNDSEDGIGANRAFLGMRSSFFKAMFYGTCPSKERETGQVPFEFHTYNTISHFVTFLYTDEPPKECISMEDFSNLYTLAHMCDVPGLLVLCEVKLMTLLTEENGDELFHLLDMALTYDNQRLISAVLRKVGSNPDFMKNWLWLELTVKWTNLATITMQQIVPLMEKRIQFKN